MSQCLIALGANLGDRSETIARAVSLLGENSDFGSLALSGWHETKAVGGPADQPAYLNGAIRAVTTLSPLQVLAELQAIERQLGRERAERWGPRAIDLDLLLYDGLILSTPELTLPHPRMAFRKFVLEPAAEVAAEMVHPQIGWTIRQLYDHLVHAIPYVAIGGADDDCKSQLAAQLALRCDARRIAGPAINFHPCATNLATGPLLQPEIEWLQQVEPLIARDSWPSVSRLAVSDFWNEQALAYGSVALAACDPGRYSPPDRECAWAELLAAWEQTRQQIVPPKLLLLLDPPVKAKDHWQDLVQQAILARGEQPGVGPVLRLTSADQQANLAEVVAAIAAMQ
jgi:2-amino-4-hydroxy-6-hydroxymethyldihydropteridine diphosphokinase